MTTTPVPPATLNRWQTDGLAALTDLIRSGQAAELPPLTWTLATTGAITGESSILDGADHQRAAINAWARHLGTPVSEYSPGDGRTVLSTPLGPPDGDRIGVIRVEL